MSEPPRPLGHEARDLPPFSVEVLRYLEGRGFDGAPKVIEAGDSLCLLEHLPGEGLAPGQRPSTAQLKSAGALLARAHSLLSDSCLAGDSETICHGDAGLHNVLFETAEDPEQARARFLIDWEFAAAGEAIHDLGDVAWTLLDRHWKAEPGAPAPSELIRERIGEDIGHYLLGYGWDESPQLVLDELAAQVDAARRQMLIEQRDPERTESSPMDLESSLERMTSLSRWLSGHKAALERAASRVFESA